MNAPHRAGSMHRQRQRLPIGLQSFARLREDGCYYVDKTPFIELLLERGSRFFLSRPRRFGKSLLLDTIKEMFQGNEALFEGLHIHDRWDWSRRRPVLRLDFAAGDYKEPGQLHSMVMDQLAAAERSYGVRSEHEYAPGRLASLLSTLRESCGERVVVLVDEYDRPILDALREPATALANRDYLRGLYSTIKYRDDDVHFAFLTGVSKFSKAGVFSGLNNLQDITLDRRYASICGYTDSDLDSVFAPELQGLDRDEIRHWYDGYNWLGDEGVYNPFDILLLFDTREFRAHWFETGTPAFLIDTLNERGVSAAALDGLLASESLLSKFDLDGMDPVALLFQTGYLTIRGVERRRASTAYRLGYPNLEVRKSLNECLLDHLVGATERLRHGDRLCELLAAGDFAGLRDLFTALLAGIPYNWHTRNDIADYEGYYASVFYSYFASQGLDVAVEDATSRGRVDLAVTLDDAVHLFEFKVVADAAEGRAMAQLKARGYAEKYRRPSGAVHLIAVEFSKATRNVVAFDAETLAG